MPESKHANGSVDPPAEAMFPGPWAAFLLCLAAIFATSLFFALFETEFDFIAALGLGQAIGLGGVAALAARRVPPPHVERIGLRPFSNNLVFPLLCLLPVVVLISEVDNYVRILLPPTPAVLELQEELIELTRIDSPYAAIQTLIVAMGISPVIEGFFFFGVVQQGLVSRMGKTRGVFLAAVLYAIFHFPAAGGAGGGVVPFASGLTVGCLLALARLGTGSVLAAMGLAGAISGIHLAASQWSESFAIPGFNAPGAHTPLVIVVPCGLAVLYGVRVLVREAASAPISLPIPKEIAEPDEEDRGGFFS